MSSWEEEEREKKKYKIRSLQLGLTLITLAIAVPVIFYFSVSLPADYQYTKIFGSHVRIAEDQATFPAVRKEVMQIWKTMNETFAGSNYADVYNSPFYWDQTYDNSLLVQNAYLKAMVERIDNYTSQYQLLVRSANQNQLVDWYDQALKNWRTESKRAGGLDWVIKGAWYLKFAPVAYFWALSFLPSLVLLVFGSYYVATADMRASDKVEKWMKARSV